MKVLQLISHFGLGGAQEVAISISEGLVEQGYEVLVVSVLAGDATAIEVSQRSRLAVASIKVCELGCRSRASILALAPLRLNSIIREWNPDLVHSHSDIPDLVLSCVLRLRRVRVVRTIHNTVVFPGRMLAGYLTEKKFSDDLVIAVSEDALNAHNTFRQQLGLGLSPRRQVIANGVAPPGRRLSREQFCEMAGADKNRYQICFAGRFSEQKGIDVLAKASSLLSESEKSSAELHLFGNGEIKPKQIFSDADVKLWLHVHPALPQITEYLEGVDMVVVPSRYEGLGLIALESLLAGTPVIASEALGLREAVPPDWPLKFPEEDHVALAELLKDVMTNRFDRNLLGMIGKQWVLQNYSLSKMISDYKTAYEEYYNQLTRYLV